MGIHDFLPQSKKLSTEMTNFLEEESINKIAREVGFIQRERKLSGFKFLDMLLFTHFNHKELSLNDLSIQLLTRYGITMSGQSIDERFTECAVVFFRTVLERVLKKNIRNHTSISFTKYGKVRIKDSTSFQLPENMKDKYKGSGGASSNASIRIQFEYDLKEGSIIELSIHPFNVQDMTNAGETINSIEPGDLVIRDLGYIKIEYLEQIQEKQSAYYLNRLHSGTNAYELIGGKYVEVDFVKLHKFLKKHEMTCMEKVVYLGKKNKLRSRMIVELIPENKYEERVRKIKRKACKNSRNVGKNAKARMALNIFITNTEIETNQVRNLYTLRWQIELMFKIWKTIGEIHKVKKMKTQRFEVFLIAKLIWITINWRIVWNIIPYFLNSHGVGISPYKLFKTLKMNIMVFRTALYRGSEYLNEFILEIAKMSPDKHKSDKRKEGQNWSYNIVCSFLLKGN